MQPATRAMHDEVAVGLPGVADARKLNALTFVQPRTWYVQAD
jgi:hypothetical protein